MNVARTRAAQLRGVSVGAISGTTAVAGHGLGGAHLPDSAALVLVVLCSAVVGAVASTTRRVPTVVVCLLLGQVLGHYLLALSSEHAHAGQWSAAMVCAHLGAAVIAAALICTAERLFAALAIAMWRLVLVLIALRDSAQRRPSFTRWGVVPLAVRAPTGCGRVTRGPPAFAAA